MRVWSGSLGSLATKWTVNSTGVLYPRRLLVRRCVTRVEGAAGGVGGSGGFAVVGMLSCWPRNCKDTGK